MDADKILESIFVLQTMCKVSGHCRSLPLRSLRLCMMPDKASLAAGLIAAVQLSDQTIVPGMMKLY